MDVGHGVCGDVRAIAGVRVVVRARMSSHGRNIRLVRTFVAIEHDEVHLGPQPRFYAMHSLLAHSPCHLLNRRRLWSPLQPVPQAQKVHQHISPQAHVVHAQSRCLESRSLPLRSRQDDGDAGECRGHGVGESARGRVRPRPRDL